MATVVARVEGVNVQRAGGLGSQARFSLAGFDENQVRFFIDGVPLEYAGYPFGLQNVPVGLAQRIDVYKGVVPVRLGADALGGAFELTTDRSTRGSRFAASYELGSFGAERLSLAARHRDTASGFFVKVESFLDSADNDYTVQARVSGSDGIITPRHVRRLHDAYGARGGNVELGLIDQPWARRLLLRAFVTDYDKEIQHNATMTVPYGEARTGGVTRGVSLRYEHRVADVSVRAVGGYVFERADFVDMAECRYNWFGRCTVARRSPGEIVQRGADLSLWDHTGFLRASVEWQLRPEHALRVSTAPTYTTRSGDNRLEDMRDPANDPRALLKWVSGAEHEMELFDGALQNVGFFKSYVQSASGRDFVTVNAIVDRSSQRALWGAGDGLRVDVFDWLFVKASYEYAIRLPEARELFGSGSQIAENLQLQPERSHNLNVSAVMEPLDTPAGKVQGQLTGFARYAQELVTPLARDNIFRFENVGRAHITGIEGAVIWTSLDDRVELGANGTYQDVRNVSTRGPFAKFNGDRLVNRPYLWANAHARVEQRNLLTTTDALSLTWRARYTHTFFRNWESVSSDNPEAKDNVPSQLVHSAVLSYVLTQPEHREVALSAELHNLTATRAYDFFGVQLPGRAFYVKLTLLH